MKKFAAILCATALTLSLTACGGKEKDVTVDTAKLAGELLETVTSDQLTQTSSDLLPSIYFYDAEDVSSGVAYTSSGATACEVAIVQSTEQKHTSEMEKLFQSHVDSQSELYASYNQGEVDKLDKAIIKSAGTYTVLCVCDDTAKAEEILKGYGF